MMDAYAPVDDTLYRACSVCSQWTESGGDFCSMHDPFGPLVLCYTRIAPDGTVKTVAPPRRRETPWCRLLRLGEQARDANAIAVKPMNPLLTHWLAESQRRRPDGKRAHAPYLVVIADQTVRCDCQATATCGHVGAIVLELERLQGAAEIRGDVNAAWNAEAVLETIRFVFPDRQPDAYVPDPPVRNSPRTPAEVQARGKAAYSDLWGEDGDGQVTPS